MSITRRELMSAVSRTHPIPANQLPKFPYLGAGAKHRVLDLWLDRVSSASSYVDLTAGSCNQPYVIAQRLGIPVATNDGSYYSYCIASGLFDREGPTPIVDVVELLLAADALPCSGLMTSDLPGTLTEEVCRWMDSMSLLIRQRFERGHREYLLATLGSTAMRSLTFRSVRGFVIRQADGTHATPGSLAVDFLRATVRRNRCFVSVPASATHGNARDFVNQFDGFSGAMVSFDPAWPYEKGTKNPYLLYHRLGEYLKGERTPEYIWPDEIEPVLSDVVSWIRTCLDRGAAEVCLWNQTTNKPSREELTSRLRQEFRVEDALQVDHKTVGGGLDFVDYVLRMTC